MAAGPSLSTTSTNGLDAGVSAGLLQQMTQQNKQTTEALRQSNLDLKDMATSSMQALLAAGRDKDFALAQKDENSVKERTQMQAMFTQAQATSQQMMSGMLNSFMRNMPGMMQQQQQNEMRFT